MKVWLGAAAALSGAGTLVYLLVRSSRRGRGDRMPSKASETHTAWGCMAGSSEDSQDASLKKGGSCERLNGHLPMEGHTDSVCGISNSAECHEDATQQNLSERTLTSGEMCDVNTSVERLSSNFDENLSELVSAKQEKIVVKEDNVSNMTTCEEVNVRPHTDDKEILQPTTVKGIVTNIVHTHDKHQQDARPGQEKDGETRECISTYAIEEKKMVASCKKEFPNSSSSQETICSDTDFSSLEGTACVSKPTETSLSAPEPVVEELSQCLILKPQCDPSCCEDRSETCHHATATVPSEFTKFSNENDATFNAEEATQKCTQMENSGMPPERHYTLVLKSSQEDFCISGKHIHDPSPTEAPLAETLMEGQERGAELNKDEPGTCIVTIEQKEKIYEKQMTPGPLASSQEDCHLRNESIHPECSAAAEKDCFGDSRANENTACDNTKEGTVLETDVKMEQPAATATLQTPPTAKKQRNMKDDATQDQGQSDSKQKEPQEQKKNTSEQEKNTVGQEHSGNKQVAPVEEKQSSCKQQGVPQEQKRNVSVQEKIAEVQEHSGNEQLALKEEEQSSYKQQEVLHEQKQGHGKENRQTQKQEQSESKQEVVIQKQEVHQKEKQSGRVQEITSKQEQNDSKQEAVQKQELSSGKQETKQTPKQSGKKQLGTAQKQEQRSNKQYKAHVEHKQSNNNKQVAATQKEEQKEGTQKQKENDKNQKVAQQEEQSGQKEGTQKQKESDRKQKVTQREVKSSHKQDTRMQKQEESDHKEQASQRKEQMSHEKEVPSPEQNSKDQVTRDQTTVSPSRYNNNGSGSKKGTMRSRGDSASADLDCDLGSEQDNINCDSSSLKSMDSGQGSSEIEPETLFVPSTFPVASQEQYIFYDFEIPQMLVGRLIGRKGAFINKIKAATEATVIVHPHKNRKLKLCSVEGTKQQVNAALEMIREHFPESQYPDITLQQVSSQQQHLPVIQPTLNAPSMQIELSAGVVVEVRVSAVVSGGELWVQQPLHPSYSALHRLQTCMNLNYGDGSNTPPLPNPISDGTVCVAHIKDHWMRCQVLSSLNGMSLVLPLDVGGTVSLPSSSLRQIRYDYMTLPFQATQCFLHGLQPMEGDIWSDIATSVMEELVSGVILFAVVVSYTEDYVPLVNLYRRDQDHFVLLNEKLVELGHAQWISPQSSS